MSGRSRSPNEKLGALLAAAGISNAGLARRVNDLGTQRGLTLRYDKTSVARWIGKGMVPQGAVPHLIAAAIGGKLGRPVPLREIGLGSADHSPDVGLAFPRDVAAAVRAATDLWRLDLDPTHASNGASLWQSLAGTFSVSAYTTPVSRWLITPADGSVARPVPDPSSRQVGHSDADKLREAAEDARHWDSKYGGGDWRAGLVPTCLRNDAAPLLLGSYNDDVGRALFDATAELSRLAGWMAFDVGQHEAAQRYYIQALRLARAAADVPLGGYVLASMSLQATYRGFAEEGIDLAQAAVERNRGAATARTLGFFHLVEARAHARAGSESACGVSLTAAESHLERARAGDEDPRWIDFFGPERLAADAAESYRDLKVPGQVRRFTEQALARPNEGFLRSRGLRLVVAAVAELEAGDLEAACAVGVQAMDVAERISSARSREYVRDLLLRLEPHRAQPRVAELAERAQALVC